MWCCCALAECTWCFCADWNGQCGELKIRITIWGCLSDSHICSTRGPSLYLFSFSNTVRCRAATWKYLLLPLNCIGRIWPYTLTHTRPQWQREGSPPAISSRSFAPSSFLPFISVSFPSPHCSSLFFCSFQSHIISSRNRASPVLTAQLSLPKCTAVLAHAFGQYRNNNVRYTSTWQSFRVSVWFSFPISHCACVRACACVCANGPMGAIFHFNVYLWKPIGSYFIRMNKLNI